MPDAKELAQASTQESQKEVVNNYDAKQGSYQEQAPQVSAGAKPPAQASPFKLKSSNSSASPSPAKASPPPAKKSSPPPAKASPSPVKKSSLPPAKSPSPSSTGE